MTVHTWTCQKQAEGVKCLHVNPKRLQKCAVCGKRRAPTKKKAHMRFMDQIAYEELVAVFGERCGICGKPPKPGKKLHRDHDHKTAEIRGLLDFGCNRKIPYDVTLEWAELMVAYLRRHAERR